MNDEPPRTGNPVVDAACADVADLSGLPLVDHVERLADAHERIGSALHNAPLVAIPDRR